MIGLIVLALVIGSCVVTLPYTLGSVREAGVAGVPRYNAGATSEGRMAPSWFGGSGFFLGTDVLGRSVLIRLLAGGGVSLMVGFASAFVSVTIGTLYGAVSGYIGGRVDALMMRIVDVLYGLPYILLVVLLAVASDAVVAEYVSRQRARAEWTVTRTQEVLQERTLPATRADARDALARDDTMRKALAEEALKAVPPRQLSDSARTLLDLSTLLIAIGGVSWLTMARVVRGQVLSLRHQPFIEAAKVMGFSRRRIVLRHILPNVTGTITVYATLIVPQAVLQESFLSFLGIGVKPPLPSWGTLVAEGLQEINPYKSHWWLIVFPCAVLGITLLCLNFVGEGLRDALDVKSASQRKDRGA